PQEHHDQNFSFGSVSFNASNLTGSYTPANNTFVVTGQSSANVSGFGNLSLNLGNSSVSSQGLVVTNGSLTNLDAAASINASLAGSNFSANNLKLNYNSTTTQFSLFGNALLSFGSSNNMTLVLGNQTSPGVQVANGSLASLNATSIVSTRFAGANFTSNGLTLNYLASPSQLFTLYGNAALNFGNGRDLSLVLGNSTSPGMSISNGSLTTLNATATTAMTLGGGTFTANALTVTYVASPEKVTVFGNASLNFGTGRDLSLVLGNATSPGMSISNGSLASLNATATTSMTLGGANFTANSLTGTYVASPEKVTVYGNASLGFNSNRSVSLVLGNSASPGMVVSNGSLTSLNATTTFTNPSIGCVSLSATNLNVD
ncbi:MAG: hypothetical protein ACKO85_14240, partial [Isosphaeraceae bacterium]